MIHLYDVTGFVACCSFTPSALHDQSANDWSTCWESRPMLLTTAERRIPDPDEGPLSSA
jgi:hypothetical protein